jgi:hypothetical protein
VVTLVGVGTCTITADAGAVGNYADSGAVTFILTITGLAQSVTFYKPTDGSHTGSLITGDTVSLGATTYNLNAVASHSGTITYATSSNSSICTIDATSGVVTLVGVGTCTITADAGAVGNYADSGAVTFILTITGLPQSITFYVPSDKISQSNPVSSDSVAYAASGTYQVTAVSSVSGSTSFTYSATSGDTGICTIDSNGLIHILSVGTCTITADAAAYSNHVDSGAVTFTLTIAGQAQTVAFFTDVNHGTTSTAGTVGYGTTSYQVFAHGSAGGTITFSSLDPGICTVASDGSVTTTGVGTCHLSADAGAIGNFADSGATFFTLTVTGLTQTVTFYATGDTGHLTPLSSPPTDTVTYSAGGTYQVNATAQPGATLLYSTSTSSTCDVNASGLVSLKTAGSCTILVQAARIGVYAASAQTPLIINITGGKLDAPVIVSVTARTGYSIGVTFNSVANSAGYTLRLYDKNNVLLQTLTGFVTGGSVSGLTPGTDYYVTLQAIGDGVLYTDSNETATQVVSTPSVPLQTPSNITAGGASSSSISVSFTGVPNAV